MQGFLELREMQLLAQLGPVSAQPLVHRPGSMQARNPDVWSPVP
jgi:hypothetical protein